MTSQPFSLVEPATTDPPLIWEEFATIVSRECCVAIEDVTQSANVTADLDLEWVDLFVITEALEDVLDIWFSTEEYDVIKDMTHIRDLHSYALRKVAR